MDYNFSLDHLIIATICITKSNNDKINTLALHSLWIWLYLGFADVAGVCKGEINVSHKTETFRI